MTQLPLCACGCGKRVGLAKVTARKVGLVKGQPTKFVPGHRPTLKPEDRFRGKFVVAKSGCWEWQGCLVNGYGVMSVYGKSLSAHRYSYELHKGDVPDGLFVLHSCNNRSCVNPDHLRAGTHRENMVDLRQSGNAMRNNYWRNRTHCKHGHEYTPENIYYVPGQATRYCKTCRRLFDRSKKAVMARRAAKGM